MSFAVHFHEGIPDMNRDLNSAFEAALRTLYPAMEGCVDIEPGGQLGVTHLGRVKSRGAKG